VDLAVDGHLVWSGCSGEGKISPEDSKSRRREEDEWRCASLAFP